MAVGDVFSSVFIKVEIKSLERFGGCHGNCALYGAFVWIQTQPLVTEKYKSAQKRNLNCYSHSINKFWFIAQYMSLPMMSFLSLEMSDTVIAKRQFDFSSLMHVQPY